MNDNDNVARSALGWAHHFAGEHRVARGLFEDLARRWTEATIPGVVFMREFGRWLEAQDLGRSVAATCARLGVPLFVPAAPDGPLAEPHQLQLASSGVVMFPATRSPAWAFPVMSLKRTTGVAPVKPRRLPTPMAPGRSCARTSPMPTTTWVT